MPFESTVDMNTVLGDAMRGRQFPQVDPQADSMGWPQLGQGRSSVRAGARDILDGSLGDEPSWMLCAQDPGEVIFRRGTGLRRRLFGAEGIPLDGDPEPPRSCFSLSNTECSPLGMIGLRRTMVNDGQTPSAKISST
jgi:hypothetical protein